MKKSELTEGVLNAFRDLVSSNWMLAQLLKSDEEEFKRLAHESKRVYEKVKPTLEPYRAHYNSIQREMSFR